MMWGYNGFGAAGMGIGMLVFWGLIVVAIVILVRGFGGRPEPSEASVRNNTPLEILRDRYARGEIDKKEFEEKRRELRAH